MTLMNTMWTVVEMNTKDLSVLMAMRATSDTILLETRHSMVVRASAKRSTPVASSPSWKPMMMPIPFTRRTIRLLLRSRN